jgi:hypothetical protein
MSTRSCTFSVLVPTEVCGSVTADNSELIFAVGNGVLGDPEPGSVIDSVRGTVSGYIIQDMQLMSVNGYVCDSEITCLWCRIVVACDIKTLIQIAALQ